MLLKKDDALFDRDEDGKLMPVEIPLTFLNKENPPTIKVIPISRSKWVLMTSMKDEQQDLTLINEHILEPKFTENDYIAMKQKFMTAINIAFLKLTLDLKDDVILEQQKKELTEAEEFALKKKSNVLKEMSHSSCTGTDTTISTSENLHTEK